MKKSQSKDTIGKIILSVLLLFLGESFFGYGLYWPVLLSLSLSWRNSYWYGLGFGIVMSVVTKTELGLASLIVVMVLFIFDRIREQIRANLLLVIFFVIVINLTADKIIGLSWGITEVAAGGLAVFLLFRLDFFSDDLHLSNR